MMRLNPMPRHRFLLAPLAVLFWLVANTDAHACSYGASYPSFTVTSLNLAYTETLATGTIQFTVTMPSRLTGSCTLALTMANVQTSLQNIQNPQAMLAYTIGAPFYFSGTNVLYQFPASQGQVILVAMPVHIPANQLGKPSGTYQRLLSVSLKNVVMGSNYQETPVLITATVAPSCVLPAPTLSAVDFTAALHNGHIPAPFQRALTFNDAGCNGPARLTLSGQPMRKPSSTDAIHYSANAIFGGTPLTLDTRAGGIAFANAIGAPQTGPIPLSVTVLPTAAALSAGTYRSTLRVSLEPAQ